ncbi:MAG: hypothetical protein SFY32_16430 [Bacteroidota bacterium]|nr:hypothetical protein [Bacteroidota bacterium]
MLIKEGVKISEFNSTKWVINTPDNRNILVNENIMKLFNALKSSSNIEIAHKKFSSLTKIDLSFEEFKGIIDDKLDGYGILDFDKIKKKSKVGLYLKLKIELLNSKIIGVIVKPFVYFFNPRFFWLSISILFITNLYFIFIFFKIENFTIKNLALSSFCIYLSLILHEMGHIAASKYFKVKHGGIGMGFYWIFPVLYADITNVWTINKMKRIIVNLAGIYFELLYSFFFIIFYLISNKTIFIYLQTSIVVKSLFQLNPFVRLDGYWILSDYIGVPNLLEKSQKALSNWRVKSIPNFYLLIGYAIVNYALFFAYFIYVFLRYHDIVLKFPLIIYNLFYNIITFNFYKIDIDMTHFIVFVFYILLIRFVILNSINLFSRFAR